MVIRNVTVNDCTPETIVIGRRGTFETIQIVFDLTYLIENYGDGTAVLALKRSQDSSAYPAVAAQDGNTLTWTVSEVDTYYVGAGVCQLMWYVDDGLAKTIIYQMVVMKDILSTAEEPPDGYENWIEHLTDLGAETLQNAQNAAQSASEAESAKDDSVTAKEASEEAARKSEEASVHAPVIYGGYWFIWDNGQYVNTNVRAEGQKGDKGDTGEKGDTGNGISKIEKTGTSGLVDTYTVTYTDGTSTTFTVTNGAKGDKGDTGATGNGIQSITKTGTSGNVDTYTITYTNGQTTTFTVTNGAVTSVAGKTGAVSLNANDIAFSESGTYDDGTVGKELSDQKNAIGQLDDVVNDHVHGLAQKAPLIVNNASGDIASFADGADGMPIKSLICSIEPVQAGSGDPSPTNVRPISGHTGLTVARTGFNVWDEEWESGDYNDSDGLPHAQSTRIRTKNPIPCKPSTSYYYVSTGIRAQFFYYDSNDNFISTTGWYEDRVITTPSNCHYMRFYLVGTTSYGSGVGINYPSTDTAYHAYTGTTIPITFPTTIYGGSDEVIGGALESTFGMFDMGSLNWYYVSTRGIMEATPGGVKPFPNNVAATCLCSQYKTVPYGEVYDNSKDKSVGIAVNGRIYVYDSAYTDAATFKTAMSGVQLCYELATPIEYTLTPTELTTLYGQNNVWTDVGDVSIDYPADTKLYIDNKIATAVANALNA